MSAFGGKADIPVTVANFPASPKQFPVFVTREFRANVRHRRHNLASPRCQEGGNFGEFPVKFPVSKETRWSRGRSALLRQPSWTHSGKERIRPFNRPGAPPTQRSIRQ